MYITTKNGLSVAIALIAVMIFAGSAQAAITVAQQVNVSTTEAIGEIATLWLDVNPSDYTTKAVQDGSTMTPPLDYYYFDAIDPMLDRNGFSYGDTGIGVTVAIYCSGTERNINGVSGSSYSNTYRNVTIAHGTVDYPAVGGTYYIPLSPMELESCAAEEPFSKTLYAGWNLISLPLAPLDNSVSAVLSGVSHDAVYRYNATSKQFESADTMDPGTGYFVHATSESAWTYSGTPYASIDISLKQGLNMVGWLNCSKDVNALSLISEDYYYVACWNTSAGKFDVYNPVAPSTFNDFTAMERGTGYFISAKQECALSESC